jgi:RHH-type rel operon transcriptional repressor/antitoxin RelB
VNGYPSQNSFHKFSDEHYGEDDVIVFLENTAYYSRMGLKTLTFRTPEEKAAALDRAAALQQRDRSFVINEAVDQYLSLQDYHLALIDEGIRQADAGHLIPHDEVKKTMAELSRKRQR